MAARSGASSGATITGLAEFRRALKAVGPEWPKELRRVNKALSVTAAGRAQRAARSMGGVQARAADAIRPRANQREVRLTVVPTKGAPMANVAFWGAKKRTGWYSRFRYKDVPTPQHPEWVGNTWDVAVAGQGPYAINASLAQHMPEYLDDYMEMLDDLARRAFPEGGR
jgi:hypothetical protein